MEQFSSMTSQSGCHLPEPCLGLLCRLKLRLKHVWEAVASLLTPFISSMPSPEHFQTSHKGTAPPPVYSHEEELRNSDKSFLHDSCNAFEEQGKHTAGILDDPMICDSEMISHYQTDT